MADRNWPAVQPVTWEVAVHDFEAGVRLTLNGASRTLHAHDASKLGQALVENARRAAVVTEAEVSVGWEPQVGRRLVARAPSWMNKGPVVYAGKNSTGQVVCAICGVLMRCGDVVRHREIPDHARGGSWTETVHDECLPASLRDFTPPNPAPRKWRVTLKWQELHHVETVEAFTLTGAVDMALERAPKPNGQDWWSVKAEELWRV